MYSSPPQQWWNNLPPADLIDAAATALYACLSKNCIGHALAKFSDNMTDDDFKRMKRELDEGTSLVALMLRKRNTFGLTGPVADDRPANT